MNRKVLLWASVAFLAAASATAQTKISGTLKCKDAEPTHKLEVGDRAGHVMELGKSNCTASQPWELGGDKYKEGYSVGASETSLTRVVVSGTHVGTYESGDKAFAAYHNAIQLNNGKPTGDGRGTWSYTGGTGKFKGIKGKGTYKVTENSDATVTVEVEGEYQLAASAAAPKK